MVKAELHGGGGRRPLTVHPEAPQEPRYPSICGCEAGGGVGRWSPRRHAYPAPGGWG